MENGTSIPLADLDEGEHVLAVEAEDEAGNVSTESVTFTLDATAPTIAVRSPTAGRYDHHEQVEVDVTVTDQVAGVAGTTLTLDRVPVQDGDTLDLVRLPLGAHVLAVRAEDGVGNVSQHAVTFTVEATITSLQALVDRFSAEGQISDPGLARSLLAKLEAAAASPDAGRHDSAASQINSFIKEVSAQRGIKIDPAAADILIADGEAVRAALAGAPR